MSAGREALLLGRLREAAGQFVSGSELATLLGVSRAAVGKRLTALRQRGFELEAVHNRGYRLVGEPDALRPEVVAPLLRTAWLGRVYFHHQRLSSTNDEAARLAEDGAPHGTVVVAEEQSAGRGRLGRGWYAAPETSLCFSAVLRPRLEPAQAPPVSLAAAVALAEAVRGFVGRPPVVKWPNDLLYGGRKWCGMLVEMSAELGRLRHLVLGVGINVNVAAGDYPAALAGRATSLGAERGSPLRRSLVLAAALGSLERWIGELEARGPAPVVEAWLALATEWLGQPVRVDVGSRVVLGVALGLDAGGALRLRRDDGGEELITAGDVELVGRAP